jgi:hypothetical protein
MEKMMRALDKRKISYTASACTPTIIAKMTHSTLKYEIKFLIRLEDGIYKLTYWSNDWELEYELIKRKTPKAIVDNMERIMKGLPRRLDEIRMAQWVDAM